jgi:hypothetical protein
VVLIEAVAMMPWRDIFSVVVEGRLRSFVLCLIENNAHVVSIEHNLIEHFYLNQLNFKMILQMNCCFLDPQIESPFLCKHPSYYFSCLDFDAR